jgi:hypothetical protein
MSVRFVLFFCTCVWEGGGAVIGVCAVVGVCAFVCACRGAGIYMHSCTCVRACAYMYVLPYIELLSVFGRHTHGVSTRTVVYSNNRQMYKGKTVVAIHTRGKNLSINKVVFTSQNKHHRKGSR